MKTCSSHYVLLVAALAAHADAFQPAISRKALLQNAARASASAAAVVLLPPQIASAADAPERKKKELLRGGKNLSDALHNGTDLNGGESAVASGLLDKMGLNDITPDKGPNARAPPAAKKAR
ncbi:hypothetical protein ACHAWF_001034 [Thalassiosira exigua]